MPKLFNLWCLALSSCCALGNSLVSGWFQSMKCNNSKQSTRHCHSRCISLLAGSTTTNSLDCPKLSDILRDFAYDRRLEQINESDLPRVVEIFRNGEAQLGKLLSIHPQDRDSSGSVEPKLVVQVLDQQQPETITVDIGQITSIWTCHLGEIETDLNYKARKQVQSLPEKFLERKLDDLYMSRVGRSRANSKGLTKKQISGCVQALKDCDRQHAEMVLRQVLKAGSNFSRLIDSSVVCQVLFGEKGTDDTALQGNRASAALALAHDTRVGGRFKRWPCIFVEHDGDSIIIVNGGWTTLDRSVRAGNEARKFVERTLATNVNGTTTHADERILRRLECLAMGEQLQDSENEGEKLELDVRETLRAMDLPATHTGAKKALIKLGRWTEDQGNKIQFWPKPVLQAASSYIEYSRHQVHEGRTDLTSLPSICIDAQRVAFRDDAIGVRPRKGTGRKAIEGASKWEILVHIADVSDIFVPGAVPSSQSEHVDVLRGAAQSRGTSRYDLPSGPLHLLPPAVLKELSLGSRNGGSNKCVTLWAYIDERDGRLLDAGFERSLIAAPLELSFSEASAIMDSDGASHEEKRIRAVLLVTERNLSLWSRWRQERSKSARDREKRLTKKARNRLPPLEGIRDDGTEGFFRTRGHRLVDSALDLHAYAVTKLLRGASAPIPRVPGADRSRGGRIATSPLRRYVDAQGQRQVLGVFCRFGQPLTINECVETGRSANEARNSIANIRAVKKYKK